MNVDLEIVKPRGADSVFAWVAPQPASYYRTHTTGELNQTILTMPFFKGGTGAVCGDFDADGDTDITDAVFLTPAVKSGVTCAED